MKEKILKLTGKIKELMENQAFNERSILEFNDALELMMIFGEQLEATSLNEKLRTVYLECVNALYLMGNQNLLIYGLQNTQINSIKDASFGLQSIKQNFRHYVRLNYSININVLCCAELLANKQLQSLLKEIDYLSNRCIWDKHDILPSISLNVRLIFLKSIYLSEYQNKDIPVIKGAMSGKKLVEEALLCDLTYLAGQEIDNITGLKETIEYFINYVSLSIDRKLQLRPGLDLQDGPMQLDI